MTDHAEELDPFDQEYRQALENAYHRISALEDENERLRAGMKAEQGERQEAVAWTVAYPPEYKPFMHHLSFGSESEAARYAQQKTPKAMGCVVVALYTTPPPGPDVLGLAASLYQACGAYDMPERILDVLSAAANGEPFTHMIAGMLPCVPPVESGVEGLVEALEQIQRWDGFPSTGKFWEGSGAPVSYSACYGSNGERDFMRNVAANALAAHRQAQQEGEKG